MIIHQVLHGYNHGHNRLASSYPLSTIDDDKMKMLSDWSEYTGSKDNSYITTYPLTDGNHYIVAKSWYADDMERPGCVWTHSLILDLNDIDDHFDFRSLLSLFKRPKKGDYFPYSKIIHFTPEKKVESNDTYQEEILIWLYHNLTNSENNSRMLYRVELDSTYYQNLILLLLQNIPLGFLKNIFTCSGSAHGRKYSNCISNLQFASSSQNSLTSIINESSVLINEVCDGIKAICKTMTKLDSDTSNVLRLFSNDIGSDYSKLCTIGLLLKHLDDAIAKSNNIPSFTTILRLLIEQFPNMYDGEQIKLTFCKKQISGLFSSEGDILTDLATASLDSCINFQKIDYFQRVNEFKTNNGIDEYAKFLNRLLESDYLNTAGEYILKYSSEHLHPVDYLYFSQNYWSLYISLVMANPTLLQYSFWIDLPEHRFAPIYEIFKKQCSNNFIDWHKLFTVVLYRNHEINDKIMSCFKRNIPNIVYEVMEYLNNSISYGIESILERYCADNLQDVLYWLEHQNNLTIPTIRFLIKNIQPEDQRVRDLGSDKWETLCQCNKYEEYSYFTFLFRLGHNWKDNHALNYIRRSFYDIHKTLAEDKLPIQLWYEIEPYTEKLNIFNEWDKCKKLRKGVIKYIKESGFQESVLSNLTPDNDLNITLSKIWEKY